MAMTVLLVGSVSLTAQQGPADGQWPYYGGDAGSTKYSALDQITTENVSTLKTQWFWGSPENASIKLRYQPGWVTFSIDGTLAYPSTGEVIDRETRTIIARLRDEKGRPVQSEKMLEIDFRGNQPMKAGDQFGFGRLAAEEE